MNEFEEIDKENIDNGGAIALKGFNYQNAVASLIAILNYDRDNFLLFVETKDDIEVDVEDKHFFIQVKGQHLSLSSLLNIKKNDKGIKNCIFSKNIKKNHPKASYHIVLLGLKKDQNSLIEATEATIFSEEYLYSSEQKTKIIQKLKDILNEVHKSLLSISFDDDLKASLATRLKKQYEITHGRTSYQLEKSKNELSDVEQKQKKLLDLLIAETISADIYRNKNAEYEMQKIDLQNKIQSLQAPDTSVERAIDKVLNFSQNSYEIFKSSQIEEKRRILNIVFANFFMEGKNPVISMRKNFNLLSNLGGCQDWCPGEDSNFHCLRQHAPEACASTNFATRASITDILLSHFKINCKHLFQKIIKISIRI